MPPSSRSPDDDPMEAPQPAPSRGPFPPVERLRPGLTSVPVPLPNSSLGHVFVYAFESDRGVYLVDGGWDTDEA